EENVKLWDIRRSGNQVAGIVSVEESTHRWVSLRPFIQGLSDAPDDSADGLAAGCLRIDDLAAVVGSDISIQADEAKVGIDDYFGEHCREAKNRLRSFRAWVVVSIGRQRRKVVSRRQVGIANVAMCFRKHSPAELDF